MRKNGLVHISEIKVEEGGRVVLPVFYVMTKGHLLQVWGLKVLLVDP